MVTPAGKAVDKHSSLDPAAIVGDISVLPHPTVLPER